MSKIENWKCRHCEKLFLCKNKMEICQRACLKKEKQSLLANEMRLTIKNVCEIPTYIENFIKEHFNRELTITKWSVNFKINMHATHDAPIGKAIEWYAPLNGKERTNYIGWTGRIDGEGSLYSNPIINKNGSFGTIDGISEIIGTNKLIYGIHSGSGSGGNKFTYDVRMYIDDFPKIKLDYEQWKLLNKKSKLYFKKRNELIKLAENLLNNNKKIIDLNSVSKILSARNKQVSSQIGKIKQTILNSKEYINAINVPKKYNFNKKLMNKLDQGFK